MTRIGFIGVGGIAQLHLDNLVKLGDVQIVAACDVVKERADACAQRFEAKAYQDYHKMLEEVTMDGLFICLPPHAHTDQEQIAAEKGIPLFIEKPIANSLKKAQEIQKKIDARGIINSVGYNWRYLDIVDYAKQKLSGAQIGTVLGYWMGGLPRVPWWRRREQSGGQVVEQTTHIYDLVRYLVGEVKEVSGFANQGLMTDVEDYNVDDSSVVNLRFENGVIGQIVSACFLNYGYRVQLDVVTKDFTLEISGDTLREISRNQTIERRATVTPHFEGVKTFIEAIRSGDGSKIKSSYADAVKTLKLTLTACESFEKKGKLAI